MLDSVYLYGLALVAMVTEQAQIAHGTSTAKADGPDVIIVKVMPRSAVGAATPVPLPNRVPHLL